MFQVLICSVKSDFLKGPFGNAEHAADSSDEPQAGGVKRFCREKGKDMHFTLTDLALFVHVAELENLTKGAKAASLSPAAASARVKALEAQLNSRLLYRECRGVKVTPAGESLLRHARIILRQVDYVKSEFALGSSGDAGHIRLFANTTAVTEFLPGLLARFMAERPRITIDLQERGTNDVVRGILDSAADIGIVAGPVSTVGLEAKCFSTDRLVVVTPEGHALTSQSEVAFAETLQYQHVVMDQGSTLHTFLTDMVKRLGRKLTLRVQMRSMEAMCRMIEAGVGIGVLPESSALHHQKTMRLEVLILSDPWAFRERSILVREKAALPSCARALVDALMALGSTLPERDVPTA
jgi:DNA-binding transcriptional LysR family regulator